MYQVIKGTRQAPPQEGDIEKVQVLAKFMPVFFVGISYLFKSVLRPKILPLLPKKRGDFQTNSWVGGPDSRFYSFTYYLKCMIS
jgi:hypothetical protein